MAINNFNAKNGLSVGSNPINIVDNTANATFATAMTTGSMGVGTPVVATSRLFVSGTSTSSDTTLVVRAGVPSPSGRLLDIRNNSGASVASIDYLGNIFGASGSFSGDITITGNLTVAGTQTIVNSEIVNIKDNIVLLNANPSPAATGGIYVADTTVNTTGSLIWDSSIDQWKAGKSGLEITLVSGSGTNNYVTKWVGSNSVGDSIVFDNGTNVGIGTTLLDSKFVVAGNAVISGSVNPSADNNTNYVLGTSAKRWSNVVATSLSGSLTKLSDGTTNYLQAGSNIAITTGSNGSVTIATTGLASTSAQYLTLVADASLSSERVFTPSTGLKFVDGGAGGNYTLSINDNIVATVSGTTFTGVTKHNAGLSGSLTRLVDGSSYIVAAGNMTVLTGSNGSISLATINSGTIHGVTANTGLLGGGTSGTVSLSINDSVVATVSGTTFTGVTKHNAGLSGSLTQLTDGTSYLIAGSNIQIATGSNGSVNISSPNAATISLPYLTVGNDSTLTNERSLTAGNGILSVDGGANGAFTLSINDSVVATVSGTTFTGVTKHNAGLSGSLTRLTDGSSYIVAGGNMIVLTGSNGAITLATVNSGTIHGVTANTGLLGGGTSGIVSLSINDNIVATVSGTTFTGVTKHNAGLSGSLTQLTDGSSYLIAGSNVQITTGSNGSVSISSPNAATISLPYLTVGNDPTLTNERALSAGNGLRSVDSGANGSFTLSINDNIVATVSGTTFTGVTKHNAGLSGSLTQLVDGSSYLVGGSNIQITTGSNGSVNISSPNAATISSAYLTVGNDSTLTNERALSAGNGLLSVDSGANGSFTLSINDNVVATVSGTTFTGVTKHNAGLSGSLTKLTDGTSYLIAGNNIQITTGSTGAVTVANTATGATYVAGTNTHVQFNDGGTFGADGDFTFDKNNNLLRVTNISGSLTSSNVVAGQVVLAGTGGVLSGSNNFWWDNSTGNVGIGTSNSNGNRLAISGGNLSVTGSVLPGASTTYDLGSTTYRWRDLHARTGSFSGDVTITGDLIVNGTQFIVNTQVVEIEDNAILLNAGPSPASSGGIYVADTTTGITGSLLWDSTTDLWKAGKLGSEVSLVSGSGTNNYLTKWVGSNAIGTSVVTDDGTNVGVGMMPTTDKLSVNGSMSVTGSLLPGVDNAYDLGSSAKRWKLIQAVNISGSLTGSNVLAGQVIVAGTGGVLSGSNNFTYNNSDLTISGTLRSVYSVGDEGGELFFTKPQTNTTLNDGVTIDLYRNRIRIFEAGGTNRGGYFDVSTLAAGASTNLVPLPAGSDTQVQFNDGGAFGANSGLTYNKTTNALTGTYIVAATGFSGSLTRLTDNTSYIIAGGNMSVVTGSNGAITLATINSGTIHGVTAGNGLLGGGTSGTVALSIDNNVVATVSGTTFTGGISAPIATFTHLTGTYVLATSGISGSLTKLSNGTSYLIGGNNISIVTGSSGAVTISAVDLAPLASSYITVGNDSTLPNERSLTAGNGLKTLDGGAGSSYTLSINDSIVATVSGATFTGPVKFNSGLSGSLTKLTDGTSYVVAGPNVTVVTGSNGSLTVTAIPAGSTGQVQFNDGGSFGGSSSFVFDKALGAVTASILSANDYLETDGYMRFNNTGLSVASLPVDSAYIFMSGSNNDLTFSHYDKNSTSVSSVRLNWLENNLSTGILNGGILSTENGTTTFSITSGSGIIVNYNATLNSEPDPTVTYVTWPTYVSQSLPNTGSAQITYIAVKDDGTLLQQVTPFSTTVDTNYIPIGRVLHQSGSVTNGTISTPIVSYGLTHWHDDFTRLWGPLKVSGHVLSPSGSNLTLKKTGGVSYAIGRNYQVNPNDPNQVTDSEVTASKIYREYTSGSNYVLDTGVGTAGYTEIDPTRYNLNGTLTNIGGSDDWSIQRVFWFPNSVNKAFFVYYGENLYATLTDALNAVPIDTFTEGNNTIGAAIFVAYIVVQRGCTNLSDTSKARIIQASISRGTSAGGAGGGGGGLVSPGGVDTYVQFNDGGSFGGDAGLTYNKTTDTLTIGNISIGDTGLVSTTGLVATLFNTTATTVDFAGAATTLNIGNTAGTNNISGVVKANQGFSGSLTRLTDGSSYLIAGSNVTIATGSNGAVTVSAPNLAPSTSAFLTLGNDSTLSNERAFTTGTGLTGTDAGANSSYTLSINDNVVATVSGTTFTGATRHNAGLSGSLTQLVNGTSYLIAGTNVQITTGSTGAVTIANTATGATYVAGSNTQVQFNDGGTFGADGDFTFDKVNNLLQVTNISGSLTGSNVLAGHVVVAGTGGLISGSNNFWWDNAGTRVGIGTSSFTARLHVSGSSTSANPTATLRAGVSLPSAGILDVQTYTGTSILDVYETSIDSTIPYRGGNGSATAPTFAFTTSTTTGMYRRTTGQLLNFTVGGSQAFGVDSSGNVAIGVSPTVGSSGRLHVLGDSAAGSTTTLLVRHGAANGANLPVLDVQNSVNTSLLFVSGSGNVGIGTVTPGARLHAYGSAANGSVIIVERSTGDATIVMGGNTSNTAAIHATAGTTLALGVGATYSSSNNFLNISSAGNVGIGTAVFTDKLAVNGSMSVTGSLLPGVDDIYDLGTSTKRWANVNAEVIVSSGSFAPAYTTASSASGTTALFDTISVTTNAAVYELMIIGNPNSSSSAAYRDVIYGKVIIGTGNNGAAVRNYIQFIAESPAPRSLYGAAGNGPLTADVVYLQAGNEFTDIAQGGTATIRVKIAGYAAGFVGNNTTVRLKQLA